MVYLYSSSSHLQWVSISYIFFVEFNGRKEWLFVYTVISFINLSALPLGQNYSNCLL